jgi:hypothetical protein
LNDFRKIFAQPKRLFYNNRKNSTYASPSANVSYTLAKIFCISTSTYFSGYKDKTFHKGYPYHSAFKFRWTNSTGANIIKSARITIGGQEITKIYGDCRGGQALDFQQVDLDQDMA